MDEANSKRPRVVLGPISHSLTWFALGLVPHLSKFRHRQVLALHKKCCCGPAGEHHKIAATQHDWAICVEYLASAKGGEMMSLF